MKRPLTELARSAGSTSFDTVTVAVFLFQSISQLETPSTDLSIPCTAGGHIIDHDMPEMLSTICFESPAGTLAAAGADPVDAVAAVEAGAVLVAGAADVPASLGVALGAVFSSCTPHATAKINSVLKSALIRPNSLTRGNG